MPYVAVSAITHPGLLRERNEDSLAVGPWTLDGLAPGQWREVPREEAEAVLRRK